MRKTMLALPCLGALTLAGCTSDPNWEVDMPSNGVQYEGQTLNSSVTDQVQTASQQQSDDLELQSRVVPPRR